MAQATEQNPARHPDDPFVIQVDACKTNDVSLMERALDIASQPNSTTSVQEVLRRGLRRAAARNAGHVLKYVLDRGADVAELTAEDISTNDIRVKPSREVLETLIAHGWDINTRGPRGTDWPLLWFVVEYPDLVRWCLDHGAKVDVSDEPSQGNADGVQRRTGRPRYTILGMAASCSTTEVFELLRSRDPPLDPLTLHYAVDQATHSAPKEGSEDRQWYPRRMDMVRHLVENLKLDVNAVKYQAGTQCSTPLCFVARRGGTEQDFRELVFFLLDHGADLNLDGGTVQGHSWPNPITCAKSSGNSNFLQAVEEWKARNANKKTN